MITDPVTLTPGHVIGDAREVMERYNISGIPIVDGSRVVGILTRRDLRFEEDPSTLISKVMTTEKLVTARPGISLEEAEHILNQQKVEKLLLVNADGMLAGLITMKDIDKNRRFPNAAKDERGRLRVGAAVGISDDDRVSALIEAGVDSVSFFEMEPKEVPVVIASLKADPTSNYEEAVREVFGVLRPGEVLEEEGISTMLEQFLFNDRRYDLGEVGRYKINQRLNLNIPIETHSLTRDDFLEISKYLIKLRHAKGQLDDIDHLGVRRSRSVGELVENQIRVGLARMSRTVRERMRLRDVETLTPSDLINARTVSCLLYTSPSPRDRTRSRMPSSA